MIRLSIAILKSKNIYIPILLFIVSLSFLSIFLISAPTNGDTYAYAFSVSHLKGSGIHPGYYMFGHLIYSFTRLISLTPLVTISLISIISGSLSVVFQYLLVSGLSHRTWVGVLSSFVLLSSGGFWFYASHGEVYIPQLAGVLLSLVFVYNKKPLLASLTLLLTISLTPSSILALPAMIFLIHFRRFDKRQKYFFYLPILIIVFSVLLFRFSIIHSLIEFSVFSPRIFFDDFSFLSIVKKIIFDLVLVYGKSFGILNIVAILGIFVLYRENRQAFWMMFLLIIPFIAYIFNLGLLTEDHLIITFIPMSVFVAYGLWRGISYFKFPAVGGFIILMMFLTSQFLLSYKFYIGPEKKRSAILKSTIENFSEQFEKNSVLISDWNFGIAFWYITQNEENYALLTGRALRFLEKGRFTNEECLKRLESSFWIDTPNLPGFLENEVLRKLLLKKDRSIYFVDENFQPNKLKKIIMEKKIADDVELKRNRVERFKNYMKNNLQVDMSTERILRYPMHVIYIFRLN